MITTLLILLLAAAQPVNDPGDDSPFSERQPVRIEPLPAARALGAYRAICMAGFPDPAAFDRAAAASDLGFVRTEDPDRGEQEYSSRHGQIVLRLAHGRESEARRDRREGRGARRRWQARCDFWVAVEERLEPGALAAAIGAALAPQARPTEEVLGFSWTLDSADPGTTLKLLYIPSTDDPRIFTLSLQRLAEGPPR
jgi:hypothetical protein